MKHRSLLILFVSFLLAGSTASASIHLAPARRSAPSNITYAVGDTGNELIWVYEAHEGNDFPTTYTVTSNGENYPGHVDQLWQDNVDIVVNVDGLAIGSYTFMITVNDNGVDQNQAPAATHSVVVTVISESTSSMETTTTPSETDTSDSPISWIFVIPMVLVPVLRLAINRIKN